MTKRTVQFVGGNRDGVRYEEDANVPVEDSWASITWKFADDLRTMIPVNIGPVYRLDQEASSDNEFIYRYVPGT